MDENIIILLAEVFLFAMLGYILQFVVGGLLAVLIVFPTFGYVFWKTLNKVL